MQRLVFLGLFLAGAAQAETITAQGVSVFGQPSLDPNFTALPYVNPKAPKGGELSQAIEGGFDSFNPYTFRGRAAGGSTLPLESLMEAIESEPGTSWCLLCHDIEYPESRDWVIFNLRDGILFSDGTPLTAEDVLFSYNTLKDKGLSSFRTVMSKMVAKAEILSPHQIKFTFTPGPSHRDSIQTIGSLPVFSKSDFEKNNRDLEQTQIHAFIGSGPYIFDRSEMGRYVVWKRNPNYWGKDLPINQGRWNFDQIRFEYFADNDSAFQAFTAGEYNFTREAVASRWDSGYNFPAFKSGAVVKDEMENKNIPSGQAWVFNLRRDQFQDIRVREAVGLMFNFQWANSSIFYNAYQRVESFWQNSDLAAHGAPNEQERAILEPLSADLPDGILTEPAITPPVSGEAQLDRRNMRKAAALLDDAGWKVDSDGLRRDKNGNTLKVEILNSSSTFDRIINPFIGNLRALGIDASHSKVDSAEFETRRRSHDYDMITAHLGQSQFPGTELIQIFSSQSIDDVFNPMGLQNKAIDKLIDRIVTATSQEDIETTTRALDRSLRALRFWVPQWYAPDFRLAYYDYLKHPEKTSGYSVGEVSTWWFDQEKYNNLKSSGLIK